MPIKNMCLVSCFLLIVSGCASFRGIPSHGGGKRFDEEQRLIAACSYKALEQIEVEELKGKTVKIIHEFTTTYGVGNAGFGGLQDIGINPSAQHYITDWDGSSRNLGLTEDRTTVGVSSSFRYRPHMSFFSSNANTDRDAAYFISCLQMKLRHEGVKIIGKGEEVTLFVLLDVLGTNRSRKDRLINHTDHLNASCEFTYYAVESKTGKLLFEARRSGSIARYSENVTMFIGRSSIKRSIESTIPLEMPIFHISPVEEPVEKTTTAKPAPKKVEAKPAAKSAPKPAPKTAPETTAKASPKPKAATKEEKEAARQAKELQELGDHAKQLIQSGDSNQVPDIIQQIQAIDPAAEELKEIAIMQQL